jgi:hypothetical protein
LPNDGANAQKVHVGKLHRIRYLEIFVVGGDPLKPTSASTQHFVGEHSRPPINLRVTALTRIPIGRMLQLRSWQVRLICPRKVP